ncbi:Protein BUD31 like protein [Nosema granulosis]|uniref:Protein BUD31 like protein n=1 Tax=Nosema granulosis TaxID=83296 RepID=A0A9P6GYU8_9MICR|nr:Protein BUD31 like protein [Nosema granulosis]
MNLTDKDELKIIEDIFEQINRQMEVEINKPAAQDIPQNYHSIFRLHHQRNRFVFERLPKISKSLYKLLRDRRMIDHDLISFWQKNGYENLCCLRCIQPIDSKHGTVCYCRVPQRNLEISVNVECDNCGCAGCSGY